MQIWHLGRLVQAIFFILPFASSIPLQTVAPQKKVYPDSELLAALALATPDSAPNSFNCSDLNAQHVECWQELDMEGYLNDWNAKKLSQCEGQKAWVNCYLSVEVGWRVSDCTSTDDGKCGSWIVDPSIHDPHVFYTVYNIYSVNQFFKDWYTAVQTASVTVSGNVGNIIDNINPVNQGYRGMTIFNILTILSSAFAFLPGYSGITLDLHEINFGARYGLFTLFQSIAQTPALLRIVFPQASTTEQQYFAMSAELMDQSSAMQTRLAQGLSAVNSDPVSFLQFTNTGAFSVNVTEYNVNETLGAVMTLALNTFVVSSTLAQNEVYAAVAVDTNLAQLVANSSAELSYPIKCPEYDSRGMCDAWYYSSRTGSTYTLNAYRRSALNMASNLQFFFDQNYTTPELLFEGSQNCTASGPGGDYAPNSYLQITDGQVTAGCVSQIVMREWDMSCPFEKGNLQVNMKNCEFTDGAPQPLFGQHVFECDLECGRTEGPYIVPYGYLGPGLLNHKSVVSIDTGDSSTDTGQSSTEVGQTVQNNQSPA